MHNNSYSNDLPQILEGGIENSNTQIYFDVTRILSRSMTLFPTGIDRVILCYVARLQKKYPKRITYITYCNKKILFPPSHLVISYLDELTKSWTTEEENNLFRKTIALEFLGYTQNINSHRALSSRPCLAKAYQFILILLKKLAPLYVKNINRTENTSHNVLIDVSHIGVATASPIELNAFCKQYLITKRFHYIHDFIPITHPEFCTPASVRKFKKYLENAIHHKSQLIFNSKYTEKIATEHGLMNTSAVDPPPSHINSKKEIRKIVLTQAKDDYFLFVSTLEPRKNHQLLLDIWSRKMPVKLILVGKTGWLSVAEKRNLQSALRCHNIEHFDDLNDNEADLLLDNAIALLFPSYAEGYGIPYVRAQEFNTPIIANNLEIFRELRVNENTVLCELEHFQHEIEKMITPHMLPQKTNSN